MNGLKRAALVFGILTLLLWADGAYLIAKHSSVHGDSGTLFGNPHYYLSAGEVLVISGVLMFAVSAGLWVAGIVHDDKEREQKARDARERPPTGDPPTSEQPGPSGRTASAA